ncbi:hypothetical protein [Congregicoccus parvus]|uniref:hypothetical protein n=1 Tax=Congregicoccus parvus TaxID=3081749 RepID=UPI003FA5EE3F
MPVSFHPRRPSEVRADQSAARRRPPSLVLRRNTNAMLVAVFPAIITALAVYVGLVYVDKIARRVVDASAQEDAKVQDVRGVDGVVELVPVLEQTPPPSPESVVEQHRLARDQQAQGARVPPPVLMPQLETPAMELPRLRLEPLPAPALPDATLPPAP